MSLSARTKLGPYEGLAFLSAGVAGEVWRARFRRKAHLLAALTLLRIASNYSFESVDTVRVSVMEAVPGGATEGRR